MNYKPVPPVPPVPGTTQKSGTSGTSGTKRDKPGQMGQAKKSILDVGVSFFKDCFTAEPLDTVNLLKYLQTDWGWGDVEEIRAIQDKELRDIAKKKLPGITPSGIFELRQDDKLIKHSGFICIDIDQKDNTHLGNYSELKDHICNIENVAYCGLSVSGRGYMVFIPIKDSGRHREHFQQLLEDFQHFNINIDKACVNESRFRFLSYDPDAYFNHSAKPYLKLYKPPTPKRSAPKRYQGHHGHQLQDSKKTVEKYVNLLVDNGIDITGTYHDWIVIGYAFANDFGEAGRDYFHLVSQYYSRYSDRKKKYLSYSPEETDKQYDKCLRTNKGKANSGAFVKRAKAALSIYSDN